MIETEHTPNPDTLKFLPGKKVSEVGPIEFLKNDKNIKVSLVNKILHDPTIFLKESRDPSRQQIARDFFNLDGRNRRRGTK